MYGSIHTHFESQYDTGNDKNSMLANFIASGARRVAVTEHGVFSSYEDLRDTVGKMKKKASAIRKRIGENAAFTYTEEVGRNDAIQTQLIRSIGWGKPDIKDAE